MDIEEINHQERVESIGYYHQLHGFESAMGIAFESWGRVKASAALAEYIARRDPYGLLDG